MATLTTNVIKDFDQLLRHSEAWDQLVESRPMRSMNWMRQWWEHFSTPQDQLHVCLFEWDGALVGAAPLYLTNRAGQRTLRLLADSGDVCTDHTTWFAKPELAKQVGTELADHVLRDHSWHRLQWEDVDTDEPAMASSIQSLESQGCLVHHTARDSCWSVELPDSWEAYLESLSKNHRKRCRRWVKRFFDSGRVALRTVEPGERWDEGWKVVLDLHAQRWGSETRPDGSFSNMKFAAFHQNVAKHFAESDQLRLCYLTLDDQPLAAEYQFYDHDTLYGYQSGMSVSHQDVGPGNLSLVASIRFAIERGLRRLDFLRGDESYKAHWLATPSQRSSLRIWRPTFRGNLERSFFWAKGQASAWLPK